MNQLGFPLLSLVIFLPLCGAVVTLFLRKDSLGARGTLPPRCPSTEISSLHYGHGAGIMSAGGDNDDFTRDYSRYSRP
jgi:hypothetical protein